MDKEQRIYLNLLGEEEDRTASYIVQGICGVATILIVVLLCFVVHTVNAESRDMMISDKQILETRLISLRRQTKKVEELEKNKKTFQEMLLTIAQLKVQKQEPVQILDMINVTIPERVWLESIVTTDGYLTLDGIALDNETVSHFNVNLRNSEFVEDARIEQTSRIIKNDVNLQQFKLTLKMANRLADKMKAETKEAL